MNVAVKGKISVLSPELSRSQWLTESDNLANNIVKVKVKLPLCLTKHHTMKAYWRSGGIAPLIL
jgi:hypothetical protein